MGGFLLVVHAPRRRQAGQAWIDRGRAAAGALGFPLPPARTVAGDDAHLVTFAREDGSGGDVSRGPDDTWLAACGTWIDRRLPGRDLDGLRARTMGLDAGLRGLAREIDGPCVLTARRGDGDLAIATDRFADCRAYWAATRDGELLVSSSSLLLAALVETGLDPVAVQELLYTGIVYEDRTLFAGIRRLPPAGVFRLRPGSAPEGESTWSPADNADESGAGQHLPEDRLWQALVAAASRIGDRFDRIACDLTGGYDSRAVVAAFRGAGVDVTATVRGGDGDPDVRLARRIASELDLELIRFPAEVEADPDLEDAARLVDGEFEAREYAGVAAIHRALADSFEVSVNGSFGELARGYWYELLPGNPADPGILDTTRIARARYATGAHDPGVVDPGTRIRLDRHMSRVLAHAVADLAGAPRSRQLDAAYGRVRMASWHARIASATNRIWPNLSPFMFAPVVDASIEAPPRDRRRGLLVRLMLASHAPDLARIPLDSGHPAEPLRPGNLHRFAPAGWRLARKVARRLGPSRSGDDDDASPLVELRRRFDLDAEALHGAAPSLFDPGALAAFLDRAREPDFGYHEQWLRLRTLQLVLEQRDRATRVASTAARRDRSSA